MSALFLLANLGLGGSERKTVAIANTLALRGYDVRCAQLGPPDTLRPQLSQAVPLADFDRVGKLSPRVVVRLRRYVVQHRVRHIVCVNLYPLIYAHGASWGLGAERPRVSALINTTTFSSGAEAKKMRVYAPLLRRSDRLIFGCRAQRLDWLRDYRLLETNSDVIYNGVDASYFDPAQVTESASVIRRRLKLPEAAFVLVSVAQFRPEKQHLDLLRALVALRERGVDARAVLVGDGPEKASISGHIDRLGLTDFVYMAGPQNDVRPYLKCADVFVQTSVAVETFSNAALEAMAMGLTLVLSNIGGSDEMVAADFIGRIYPPGDVSALVQALATVAARPKTEDHSASKRAAAVQRFSHSAMVDAYERMMFNGEDRTWTKSRHDLS